MDYKIVVTKDAEEDLDNYIKYLLYEKESIQAARNVLDDFEATKLLLVFLLGGNLWKHVGFTQQVKIS